MAAVGKAFCPDYVPENPTIAFILDIPSKDDAVDQKPFSGSQGAYFSNLLITGCGLRRDEVLLANTIRCVQPATAYGKAAYPSGYLQKPAELNCRFYDQPSAASHTVTGSGSLLGFDPNVFVLTHHPRQIFDVGCYHSQIKRDVDKAVSFIRRGYRPAVIFGAGACELYFPALRGNGGMKNWRGHWWVGDSPFKNQENNEKAIKRKLFVEG